MRQECFQRPQIVLVDNAVVARADLDALAAPGALGEG